MYLIIVGPLVQCKCFNIISYILFEISILLNYYSGRHQIVDLIRDRGSDSRNPDYQANGETKYVSVPTSLWEQYERECEKFLMAR